MTPSVSIPFTYELLCAAIEAVQDNVDRWMDEPMKVVNEKAPDTWRLMLLLEDMREAKDKLEEEMG